MPFQCLQLPPAVKMYLSTLIIVAGLAATVHAQWQHVSDVEFYSLLDSSDLTLAAFVMVSLLPA